MGSRCLEVEKGLFEARHIGGNEEDRCLGIESGLEWDSTKACVFRIQARLWVLPVGLLDLSKVTSWGNLWRRSRLARLRLGKTVSSFYFCCLNSSSQMLVERRQPSFCAMLTSVTRYY